MVEDIVTLPLQQLHVRIECPTPPDACMHEFAVDVVHRALNPIRPIEMPPDEQEAMGEARFSLTLQDMPALRGVKMKTLNTSSRCIEWLSRRAYELDEDINDHVTAFSRKHGYRGTLYFGSGNVEEEEVQGESAPTLLGVLTLSLCFTPLPPEQGLWRID